MISAGSAFKCREHPGHVFIVITPPDENDEALVVNLSSLKTEEVDKSCILLPNDYPEFVRRPTVVMYRRAIYVPVNGLDDPSKFMIMPPVSSNTLLKIQQGAVDSDFVRGRWQEIVRREMSDHTLTIPPCHL